MPELPAYLSTNEVAQLVGVDPSTVEKWRAHGAGPRWTRLGRTRVAAKGRRSRTVPRYKLEDVLAWLKSREVPTRDQP